MLLFLSISTIIGGLIVSRCNRFYVVQSDCKGLQTLKDSGCGFIVGGLENICNFVGRENRSRVGMCQVHFDILTGRDDI